MDLTTIDPLWWIALGVLVILVIGLLVWSGRRRTKRTERLKGQFKSEYDRTASSSSRKETEEDLERRTAHRRRVDLAELTDADADDLRDDEDELLRSFVDGPQGAALGMTELVGRVAAARGYVATEVSVLDLVSVDHPEQVAAMRRSQAEMATATGADLTEASRRTFLNARVLAERLLAEGRAGHLDDDVTEPASPAPQRPPSNTSADTPTPAPVPPEQPPAAQPYQGVDTPSTTRSTTDAITTDGAQTAPRADEPPRR